MLHQVPSSPICSTAYILSFLYVLHSLNLQKLAVLLASIATYSQWLDIHLASGRSVCIRCCVDHRARLKPSQPHLTSVFTFCQITFITSDHVSICLTVFTAMALSFFIVLDQNLQAYPVGKASPIYPNLIRNLPLYCAISQETSRQSHLSYI